MSSASLAGPLPSPRSAMSLSLIAALIARSVAVRRLSPAFIAVLSPC